MRGLWRQKLLLLVLLPVGALAAAEQAEIDGAIDGAIAAADSSTTAEPGDAAAAPVAEAASPVAGPARATAIVPGSELESMTGPLIRMVLSLTAVLAVLGVVAWLAKRFRGGQLQGGLIQIVSGLSLGPKEKVVLLRVGEEEILVGMSPAGMQQLHVLNKPAAKFSLDLAETEGKG